MKRGMKRYKVLVGSESVLRPSSELQVAEELRAVRSCLADVPWDREEEAKRALTAAGRQLPGIGLHFTPPGTLKLRLADRLKVSVLPALEPVFNRITRVALSSGHLKLGDVQDFLAKLGELERIELTVAERLAALDWTCEQKLPQVRSLRVSGEYGDLAVPVGLAEVCGLRSLDLSQWQGKGSTSIESLLRRVSSPNALNLRGLKLTDQELGNIAKLHRFEQLETLDLSHNSKLVGRPLVPILHQATSLRELNLFNCSAIGAAWLGKALASCKTLERLFLNNCQQLDDEAICQLQGPVLVDLNMNHCSGIGSKGVRSLADKCPRLKTLFLRGCQGATGDALEYLLQRCQYLEKLDITDCPNLTNEELATLARHCEERGVTLVSNTPIQQQRPRTFVTLKPRL
jgi:hypothetical protein